MPDLNPEDILLGVTIYGGVVLAAFWLAMIIWTYRDMRARSRDTLAQILVTVIVALLTLPGLLIYLFLRPRETLSEAYERSLEEEALLQEIEEKPACPACGQRVRENWQACPYCHTRLKKPCIQCHQTLELSWNLCPYCAANQLSHAEPVQSRYMPPATTPAQDWRTAPDYTSTQPVAPQTGDSLEFIDGDDYR